MSVRNNGKIIEVDVLRVVASIAVLMYHINIMPGGFLAVEIFAVLSGVLMAKSVDNNRLIVSKSVVVDTIMFVYRKIRGFYPELFISTMLDVACQNYAKNTLENALNFIGASLVGNVFLLKMSGLIAPNTGACFTAWYVSSMIISALLIYPFLRKIKGFAWCLIPAAIIYVYLYFNVNETEYQNFDKWLGFTYSGNLRICSEMLLGIGIYPVIKYLWRNIEKSRVSCTVVKWFQYAALSGLLLMLITKTGKPGVEFFLCIIVYFVCVFAGSAGSNKGVKTNLPSWCSKLGALSLAIYLTHVPAIFVAGRFCSRFCAERWQFYLLMAITTSVFSAIAMYGGSFLRQLVRKRLEIRKSS